MTQSKGAIQRLFLLQQGAMVTTSILYGAQFRKVETAIELVDANDNMVVIIVIS
ncbi:MAG: hypothetical protein H0V39_04865 [Nitrosomonas sp.]|nr:hypothetical protein [Nitrosomonas sp.]